MIGSFIRRLLRQRRGTLAVEIAMATPILAGLVLSGVEVTRFVVLNQKIERATVTMADLVSQAESLAEGDLANLFAATAFVMTPYDVAAEGRVVVTSIGASGGNPAQVNWQRAFGAGAGASAFGAEGGAASLPAGFVVRDSESVIAAEIYYDYQPMFFDSLVDPANLYSYAIFRPRFSALNALEP